MRLIGGGRGARKDVVTPLSIRLLHVTACGFGVWSEINAAPTGIDYNGSSPGIHFVDGSNSINSADVYSSV